jgi:hypothetical protein
MAAPSHAAALLTALSLGALAFGGPAHAQLRVARSAAPKDLPPAEADIWPWPAPDPQSWWDDPRPVAPEAADPLGDRRLGRDERPIQPDNGIDPSGYRLWDLPPLQSQALREGEMILEVWMRPSRGVRQAVIRITVRRDGKAFVQARAGEACCQPSIGRRVGFDAELPADAAGPFLALRGHAMWDSPRDVRVRDPSVSTDNVCVNGVAYDLTLAVPGRARTLHRECDDAEIGEVADALAPVVAAAMGHEPRIDVLLRRNADFSAARAAYEALVGAGGSLRQDPDARPPSTSP